jgi:hypothetical protein
MATFAGNYLHVYRRNLVLLAKSLTAAQVSPGWVLFAYRRGAEQLLAGVSHGGQPRRLVLDGSWGRIEMEPCASFVAACKGNRTRTVFRESASGTPDTV